MKTLRKVLFFRRALALGTLAGLLALAAPALADDAVVDTSLVPPPPAASADDGAGDASGGQGYGYVRLVEGPAGRR
jgi:hypothetical protein